MIISGIVNRFLEPNTDTDVIIPARFLKRTSLEGFEPFAFFEKRYTSETICQPSLEKKDFIFEKKVLNPDCSLNHPNSKGATFLITWFNFGCGSSREHAVYALHGYQVIIGSAPEGKTAFADIFRDNCRQNLIRTPVIAPQNHKILIDYVTQHIDKGSVELSLDTEKKTIQSCQVNQKNNLPPIPYELPDHHEDYILKGKTPFEMARKSIAENLRVIEEWNQVHHRTLENYPNSN